MNHDEMLLHEAYKHSDNETEPEYYYLVIVGKREVVFSSAEYIESYDEYQKYILLSEAKQIEDNYIEFGIIESVNYTQRDFENIYYHFDVKDNFKL